eukprot:9232084-Pyramimonas_sp.AAC.1
MATDIMWHSLSSISRSTMFLEVFGGVSETTSKCTSEWGMTAYSVEKDNGPWQNVCTAVGLLYT